MSDYAKTIGEATKALSPRVAKLDELLEDGRVLRLRSAYNVRELGGYPTTDGGSIAYHRFLRSDALSSLITIVRLTRLTGAAG